MFCGKQDIAKKIMKVKTNKAYNPTQQLERPAVERLRIEWLINEDIVCTRIFVWVK